MSSPTKVPANMTSGVIKTAEKASATGTSGSSQVGAVVQLNSSEKIPSQYLSTGVHLGGIAANNLLDDYEEGTWTPALVSGGGITFSSSEAIYRKIGTLVFLTVQCSFSGTSSNRAVISGLPFAVDSAALTTFSIYHSGGSLPSGAAFISNLSQLSGGKSSTDMSYSDVNGTVMRISGCYVAS
jgi:hypothetical protein